MALQTSVGRIGANPVRPGTSLGLLRYDGRIVGGRARKKYTLTIDTANNSADYDVTLDGWTDEFEDSSQTPRYTSDASATKPEIQAGIIAAVLANAAAARRWEAYESSTDKVIFEARRYGDDPTVTEDEADFSLALTTPANSGAAIPFGRLVMLAQVTGEVELPAVNTPVAQVDTLTPATPDAQDIIHYRLETTDDDGVPVARAGSVNAGATVQATVEALQADMATVLSGTGVTPTEDDAKVILTGRADGRAFHFHAWVSHTATGGGDTTLTLATATAPTLLALDRQIAGLAIERSQEGTDGSTATEYSVGESFPVAYHGPAVAEIEPGLSPSLGDKVHVRVVASGTKKVGQLTNTEVIGETIYQPGIQWTDHITPGAYGDSRVASVFLDLRGRK